MSGLYGWWGNTSHFSVSTYAFTGCVTCGRALSYCKITYYALVCRNGSIFHRQSLSFLPLEQLCAIEKSPSNISWHQFAFDTNLHWVMPSNFFTCPGLVFNVKITTWMDGSLFSEGNPSRRCITFCNTTVKRNWFWTWCTLTAQCHIPITPGGTELTEPANRSLRNRCLSNLN